MQIICTTLQTDNQPCQYPITQFFTGRMLFLTPNQQCQSTHRTAVIISSLNSLCEVKGRLVLAPSPCNEFVRSYLTISTSFKLSPAHWVQSRLSTILPCHFTYYKKAVLSQRWPCDAPNIWIPWKFLNVHRKFEKRISSSWDNSNWSFGWGLWTLI